MIILKLLVGNDLFFFKNEKMTKSNGTRFESWYINFIKSSLKSSNIGFIIAKNPILKHP